MLKYQQAINLLKNKYPDLSFFFFSDDPQWCQTHLPVSKENAIFVSHNAGASAWEDLVLMGMCKHHIIANSSFSWWGAWLADQRHAGSPRLVYAPKQWFALTDVKNSDRFPAHWQVI